MKYIPCPIALAAKAHPTLPAVVSGNKSISYLELETAIEKKTKTIKNIPINTKIALLGENSVEFVITLFALWRHNCIPTLLNRRLPPRTIKEQLKELKCRHLLTPKENLSFNSSKKNLEKKSVQYPADQIATIIFTSGTSSGKPKAAAHTFANHYYSAKGSNEVIPLESSNKWLLALPLYHVGGLSILFRIFSVGGAVIIPHKNEDLHQSIKQYHPTHISVVAAQLQRLLKNKPSISRLKKMKVILLGGGPASETLIRDVVKNQLPVRLTYGLTEMSSQVATSEFISSKKSSCHANVLPYRQVRVTNGEIFVKGKTLFTGYLKKQKLEKPFQKGWFATGDLGEIFPDGRLRVLGRKDNMFISGGENIQPEEIEAILRELIGIEDVVVIPRPNPEFGMRPVAFLKIKNNCAILHRDITNFLSKHLPKYKIPDAFYRWPKLSTIQPLSKVNRILLQQILVTKSQTLRQVF